MSSSPKRPGTLSVFPPCSTIELAIWVEMPGQRSSDFGRRKDLQLQAGAVQFQGHGDDPLAAVLHLEAQLHALDGFDQQRAQVDVAGAVGDVVRVVRPVALRRAGRFRGGGFRGRLGGGRGGLASLENHRFLLAERAVRGRWGRWRSRRWSRSRRRRGPSPAARPRARTGGFHPLDDQLGDPVAPAQHDRLGRVGVEQRHADLAAVAGVDRSGGIDHGQAVAYGQSRARVHQSDVPERQGQRDAGRHQGAFARGQRDVHRAPAGRRRRRRAGRSWAVPVRDRAFSAGRPTWRGAAQTCAWGSPKRSRTDLAQL